MSDYPPPPNGPSGYSNYPRTQYGGGDPGYNPYQRPPGVYFDVIGQAWTIFQSNMATWVLSVLVAGITYYAIGIPYSVANFFMQGGMDQLQPGHRPPNPFDPTHLMFNLGGSFIVGCFGNVLMAGLFLMGLKQIRGEQISVGDVFLGFKRFGSLVGANLLTGLMIVIGIVLLIVPGLFLSGLLVMVPLLILDRNMGTVEAIQECWDRLRPYAFSLFGLMFVLGLVQVLGFCLCCVGALFTLPVYFIAMGLTYNNFFPRPPMQYQHTQIGVEPPR
jgi:hypothetical protein